MTKLPAKAYLTHALLWLGHGTLAWFMVLVVGVGLAAGIALALVAAPVLASLLHGVEPTDLTTTFIVGAILLTVTLFASWLPARRAARLDPVKALDYQ